MELQNSQYYKINRQYFQLHKILFLVKISGKTTTIEILHLLSPILAQNTDEKLRCSLQSRTNSDSALTRFMLTSAIVKFKKFSKVTDGICGAALDFTIDLLVNHMSMFY